MGDVRTLALAAAEVATGLLGWSPTRFWRATPAEVATALRGRLGPGATLPLDGATLKRLEEGMGHG